jgi:hypothetical protein
MGIYDDVPCRVSADLRLYQSEQNKLGEQPEFDEHDEDMLHDIVGNARLAKPVQALLLLLAQFKAYKRTFGVDNDRFAQMVLPELELLRKACEEEWRDQ